MQEIEEWQLACIICIVLIALGCAALASPEGKVMLPAQAARGKAIFFDESRSTKCATCHQMEKAGNSIAPDLTRIARISPKALEISILSTRTVYVKEIELKIKRKFPALIQSETTRDVVLYNLSRIPPEKMVVEKMAIQAIRDNGTWVHPPESTGYTRDQLADVIAYIRFAAFGDTKGVDLAEIQ
jgi:hypothetical protein